jgi:simple sugar transport system ATP-binding protein
MPLFEAQGISKHFGAIQALEQVDLSLEPGEVLGLMGDNGAGKSTLVKIMAGNFPPTGGEMRMDGAALQFHGPVDARRHGIEVVYQDLALCDNLTAAANVFLGREIKRRIGPMRVLDYASMYARAGELFAELKSETRPRDLVHAMSGGQRQAVAIARAIEFRARVLLLDEPTAALGPAETRAVGDVVRRLRDEGVGLFLVSHDLHDVFSLSDRIAVMRSGRLEALVARDETDPDALLELLLAGGNPRGA